MKGSTGRNIRLGVFVVAGTILLVSGMYFIGAKRSLFGSTFRISAQFHNVNGLMKGNNVRFAGINVGTVETVKLFSDSLVNVVMLIERNVQPYIRKNSLATVGTEGLMGNKLVNINSLDEPAAAIEEGDVLSSLRPIEGDEMLRTLNTTNENVMAMSQNLRTISQRFEGEKGLWALLTDTVASDHVNATLVNIRRASNETARAALNLGAVTDDIRQGKGSVGMLLTDTAMSERIRQVVAQLEQISDSTAVITSDLSAISTRIREGKGAAGLLLSDSAFGNSLNETMLQLERGTRGFEENMEALKHSWPFKKYFKNQAK